MCKPALAPLYIIWSSIYSEKIETLYFFNLYRVKRSSFCSIFRIGGLLFQVIERHYRAKLSLDVPLGLAKALS